MIPDIDQQLKILQAEVDWRKRKEAVDALGKIQSDEAFHAIVSALDDENKNVVTHAVHALRKFGPQAVPILLDAMSKPDQISIIDVMHALQEVGDQRAIPALKLQLENPDDRIALEALKIVLSLMDEQETKPFVSMGLKGNRPSLQVQYALSAARLGMVEAIPILYKELTEPAGPYSYLKRKYPALALGELGDAGLDYLLEASHYEDEDIRKAAVEGLTLIPNSRATARMIELLDDPNPSVRSVSMMFVGARKDIDPIPLLSQQLDPTKLNLSALSGLGHTGKLEAVPVILQALPKWETETAEALFDLSHRYWQIPLLSNDTSRIPELAQALESNDYRLVITAVWVLGSFGFPYEKLCKAYVEEHGTLEGFDTPPVYRQIREHLMPLLSHADSFARYATVHAMSYLGDDSLFPVFNRMLAQDKPYIAQEVLGALDRFRARGVDTSALAPGLLAAMKRSEKEVARRATLVLGETEDTRLVLLKLTEHPDVDTRRLAVHTLHGHYQEDVLLRLLELLQNDPSLEVREAAAFALYKHKDPRAIAPLTQVVNDIGPNAKDTYEIRQWAALGLAHFDDDRAVSALLYTVDNAPEWQIKKYAIEALGRIGNSKSCADRLYPLLDHDDSLVRVVSANWLGYVGTRTSDEDLRADIVQHLIPKLTDEGRGHMLRPTVAIAAATSLHYIGTKPAQDALEAWRESVKDA